ncbi:hypothetical protein AUJ40_00085 [Candidatus Berkelbacteria bacterium CG1_02_42_45]|uniref:Uncharacterized protein n=3 Tax=Candidatus Berkelbacteria TaxID=1618330 RepID=A0A2M7K1H5_9BACT|nr:MAG: hypothetical protein AUJ40_00085 [Candidatus Berkelbacteria bacterium CG1_02_42_45]PIR27490.1 MAG: hypothetical protein COV40_00630 [Candidatus Berkelbacteria bacterium CG11_big_fil_rev_8_21_14_0_20_42_15]PIX30080.1 MAG: hypothetical protein COZ63_01645 [Candidatus Berkelbacteria bacterium CG_4_8_14_3_um_filter_42_13]
MKKWFWLGFILLNAVIFGTSAAFHRLGAVIDAAAVQLGDWRWLDANGLGPAWQAVLVYDS